MFLSVVKKTANPRTFRRFQQFAVLEFAPSVLKGCAYRVLLEIVADRYLRRLIKKNQHLGHKGRCLIEGASGKLYHRFDLVPVNPLEPR
jgi:hypothetical protein